MKKKTWMCEYKGCKKKATRILKTKAGILGRYCDYHYHVVIGDLRQILTKGGNTVGKQDSHP